MNSNVKTSAKEVIRNINRFKNDLKRACEAKDAEKVEKVLKTYHVGKAG